MIRKNLQEEIESALVFVSRASYMDVDQAGKTNRDILSAKSIGPFIEHLNENY